MSDLQCPAVVLFVPGEALADAAEAALTDGRRVSGVFVAPGRGIAPRALACAAPLADAYGCPLDLLADAVDVAGLADAVEHLADLYRGETIAVVASRAMLDEVLGPSSGPTEPVAFAVDGAGWTPVAPRVPRGV